MGWGGVGSGWGGTGGTRQDAAGPPSRGAALAACRLRRPRRLQTGAGSGTAVRAAVLCQNLPNAIKKLIWGGGFWGGGGQPVGRGWTSAMY